METQPKSVLLSKTIWGILVMALPQIIDLAQSGALGPKAAAIVTALGAALAVFGRVTATQPVQIKPSAGVWLLMCLITGMGLPFGGCSTMGKDDQKLVAQLAITFATGKVIENNPSYAPKIAVIAAEVGKAAGGQASTVSAIMVMIRERIDMEKLSPADKTAVNTLLVVIEAELTKRVESGIISPDKALLVREVASWIEATAKSYLPPE